MGSLACTMEHSSPREELRAARRMRDRRNWLILAFVIVGQVPGCAVVLLNIRTFFQKLRPWMYSMYSGMALFCLLLQDAVSTTGCRNECTFLVARIAAANGKLLNLGPRRTLTL